MNESTFNLDYWLNKIDSFLFELATLKILLLEFIESSSISDIDRLAKIFSIIGSAATFFGLFGIILTAWYTIRQLKTSRALNREAVAKQIYAQAIHSFVEHPQYAEPIDVHSFNTREYVQYKWVVGEMLNALEEMLFYSEATGETDHWRHEILLFAKLHSQYLSSHEFQREDRGSYSEELMSLVDKKLNTLGSLESPRPNLSSRRL